MNINNSSHRESNFTLHVKKSTKLAQLFYVCNNCKCPHLQISILWNFLSDFFIFTLQLRIIWFCFSRWNCQIHIMHLNLTSLTRLLPGCCWNEESSFYLSGNCMKHMKIANDKSTGLLYLQNNCIKYLTRITIRSIIIYIIRVFNQGNHKKSPKQNNEIYQIQDNKVFQFGYCPNMYMKYHNSVLHTERTWTDDTWI